VLAEARTPVVEDEAMIALDLQNMLKNLGYDVSDPASSGAEALALATAERSELASMDIRIKGPIDGVEIARELRERRRSIRRNFFWAWIFTKTAKPGGDCSHVTRRARWLIGYLGENGD
jgi:CheY-like chemotaxis protein